MDSVPGQIDFKFLRLRFVREGIPFGEELQDWMLLLRLVAKFSIEVNGKVLYEEDDFPVVEFASCSAKWLVGKGDFEYTSMESELSPLLAFYRQPDANYRPFSAHLEFEMEGVIAEDALTEGLLNFIDVLRRRVNEELGLSIEHLVST